MDQWGGGLPYIYMYLFVDIHSYVGTHDYLLIYLTWNYEVHLISGITGPLM